MGDVDLAVGQVVEFACDDPPGLACGPALVDPRVDPSDEVVSESRCWGCCHGDNFSHTSDPVSTIFLVWLDISVKSLDNGSMSKHTTTTPIPIINKKIARIVRILLAATGSSQQDLAAALEMTPELMSRRINGERPWRVDELEDLGTFFDVPAAIFLHDPESLPLSLTDLRKAGASWSDARIAVEQALPAAA